MDLCSCTDVPITRAIKSSRTIEFEVAQKHVYGVVNSKRFIHTLFTVYIMYPPTRIETDIKFDHRSKQQDRKDR